MKVIVCGGGIVGMCVSHFLMENGVKPTLVEQNKVACGASGKAGGFMARDWCDKQSPMGKLQPISFDMHEELAIKFNGNSKYDYRRCEAFSLSINKDESSADTKSAQTWLNGSAVDINSLQNLGTTSTIAQLHPYKFVQTLHQFNVERGLEVMEGVSVCDITVSSDKSKITGVKLSSGATIDCDVIIIAMGPWSGIVAEWIPNIPSTYGQKAHSVTVIPSAPVPGESIFTDDAGECCLEIYPRPNNEVYICGMAEIPLPSKSVPSTINTFPTGRSCEKLKEISDTISTHIKDGDVTSSRACYMPVTQDGVPVIGKVPGMHGLYIAAGHSCWGIVNSPATGKALADIITKGKSDIDISGFDPARFV